MIVYFFNYINCFSLFFLQFPTYPIIANDILQSFFISQKKKLSAALKPSGRKFVVFWQVEHPVEIIRSKLMIDGKIEIRLKKLD